MALRAAAALAALAAACAVAAEPAKPPADGSDIEKRLERMALEPPQVPVTSPEGPAPEKAPPPLPADGSPVVARRCRMKSAPGGWFVLEFEPEPGRADLLPRRVLPCRALEKMEAVHAKRPDVRFRVSGETTVYRRKCYLLLSHDPVVLAEPAAKAQPTTRPADEGEKPATGAAGATSRPSGEPTAEEISEALMRDRPPRLIDPSLDRPAPPAPVESVAPKPAAEVALTTTRGGMVADRLVRIGAAADGWSEARFKSDNTLREPPMLLLPCRLLETAEKLGGVVHVSGLVTQYKGRRYLLLRKALRQRRMGQF
jgi:hypothetical protein